MASKRKRKQNNNYPSNKIADRIRVNENIARYLRYGTLEDREKAIELYKENIEFKIPCESYSELIILYMEEMKHIKAINVAKKGIKVYAEHETYNDLFEMIITSTKMDKKTKKKITHNNNWANGLIKQGRFDKAIELYKKNLKMVDYTPTTYLNLSYIYRYQKKFELERNILRLAIKRFSTKEEYYEYYEYYRYNSLKNYLLQFKASLNNVESYLKTGKWLYEELPKDPEVYNEDIREAKKILEDARKRKNKNNKRIQTKKKRGYQILEEILNNGTYTNTVYQTLFESYYSDKRYDDAIKVCNKAIKELGLFSKEHEKKWKLNLDKAIKRKSPIEYTVNIIHQERDKKANDLLKQGKRNEAIKLYEKNITEMTLSDNTYSKLVNIYMESERYEDAKRICMQAIEVIKPFNNKKVKQYRRKLFEIIMGYAP